MEVLRFLALHHKRNVAHCSFWSRGLCHAAGSPPICLFSHICVKMGMLVGIREASLRASCHRRSGFRNLLPQRSAVQEPLSLCGRPVTGTRYLPDRVDRDEQPRNHPGQDQYADDDRIDIPMDSLQHLLLTHLSSACAADGCADSSCVVC